MTVIHQSATVVTVVGGFQVLLVLFCKLVASELSLKTGIETVIRLIVFTRSHKVI